MRFWIGVQELGNSHRSSENSLTKHAKTAASDLCYRLIREMSDVSQAQAAAVAAQEQAQALADAGMIDAARQQAERAVELAQEAEEEIAEAREALEATDGVMKAAIRRLVLEERQRRAQEVEAEAKV